MDNVVVEFRFSVTVPVAEIEGTLRLAELAAESLHGADRVRMEAAYSLDQSTRVVRVDTRSAAGQTLALVFSGYARREFGDDAFTIITTRGMQCPELKFTRP